MRGRVQSRVETERRVRVALYGDVDLNILDGSAVWLASVAQTLATGSFVDVVLLTKAPIERPLLVEPLRALESVRLLQPGEAPGTRPERLTPAAALDALEALDASAPCDAFVLRGFALCRAAADRPGLRGRYWAYLTDVPQRADALTDRLRADLQEVAAGAGRVLCQTEALRGFLETHAPAARGRTTLLPPMIPPGPRPPARARPVRKLAYAGKFAPLWGTLEMFDAFERARRERPDLELHVFGDKIHDPRDDRRFAPAVARALERTPGLVWHRGLRREEVLAALPELDVAWSWRLPALDDSLELSTKVLEYGAAGLPVILNRNPMNEGLLGPDYPLFAASPTDVARLLSEEPEESFRLAADRAWERSRTHTFDRVFEDHLAGPLRRLAAGRPEASLGRIEPDAFDRPKLEGATFNLGLAAPPSAAQLEPVLEILELLRARDERFVLYVRGRPPRAHRPPDAAQPDAAQPDPLAAVYARIERSPLLRQAVVFDGEDAPPAAWYRKIGFAVAAAGAAGLEPEVLRAALSGAVPVLRVPPGAAPPGPASWCRASARTAAAAIRELVESGELPARRAEARAYAKEHFAPERVAEQARAPITPDA